MTQAQMNPPKFGATSIMQQLTADGWCLLRSPTHTVEDFGQLVQSLVERLTFDPARENVTESVQKVDAGSAAVGLHIENGNTPMPPDLVAFFSSRAAGRGSQTTVCDGVEVWRAMPVALRKRFAQPFTMTRRLEQAIWRRYVGTAFGMAESAVDVIDLNRFMAAIPGQSYQQLDDGAIAYALQIEAVRRDNLSGQPAFANALLGPSWNYEQPVYRFGNGELIDQATLAELKAISDSHIREIEWCDGDIALIDNKRFMHGRRAIDVPLNERELSIAMGLGWRQ